jgi:hypothetical protein
MNNEYLHQSWITYSPSNRSYENDYEVILTNFYPDNPDYDAVKQVCKELDMQIGIMKHQADIVACTNFMLILDPDKLEMADIDSLNILEAKNIKEYSVLFTKKPSFKLSPILRRYTIKQPRIFNYDNLKLILLNKRNSHIRYQKKITSFDKKQYRMMYILLHTMSKSKHITTHELCLEFNVSEKTIHRDIEMLNILGNYIAFNKKTREWELSFTQYKFDIEYDYTK